MDARFNREELIRRVESIAKRKSDIKLYNKDINSFITRYIPQYEENALVYFDPPYFKKGKQLYMNYFKLEDHVRIERVIRNYVQCDWIITYDYAKEIEEIYKDYSMCVYDLKYSVSSKCKASELMIFKDGIVLPRDENLQKQKIKLNIRPYVSV